MSQLAHFANKEAIRKKAYDWQWNSPVGSHISLTSAAGWMLGVNQSTVHVFAAIFVSLKHPPCHFVQSVIAMIFEYEQTILKDHYITFSISIFPKSRYILMKLQNAMICIMYITDSEVWTTGRTGASGTSVNTFLIKAPDWMETAQVISMWFKS